MLTYKDFMAYRLSKDNKLITNKWLHQINSAEYRQGLLYVYENIFQYHCQCWLYDASTFVSPDIRDQKWTMDIFGALLAKSTLQKIAVLLPEDAFLLKLADDVQQKANPIFGEGVVVKYFFNADEANEWLTDGVTNAKGNKYFQHEP
ncbi:hypothetical protein ACFSKU_00470 [Pontibacter silvestris]|uniref:STAS/SEC14 domain-containing protein n=1 Tax=Pontibacter silvestris TaxID=2305183 RepID=A0ABW4WT49_9BACT|nr:hypothetical protein [Pontibacter silvestris]MCC9138162.1 hypothetical protein [Pontibacter silvestris]